MPNHPSFRAAWAVLPLVLVATLAACTSPDDDAQVSATPTATTAEPAPSATATTASPSSEASATASATAAPEPTATASSTVDDGSDAVTPTQGSVANSFGTTDPEEVFAMTFGSLTEADGVVVEHQSTTTDSGAPLLIVDMRPVEGFGGDSTLTYYALSEDRVVQGVITSPDGFTDAQRKAFEAEARAAVVS
ncbi:hypothetical protein [Demequina gelatinilytica]|uniref:hypothetical protein n=1 Tax=Demequina gelatinilytica TaxID=1638980 RepID=UPI000784B9F7|nr:hypothetical protein [Demequina gelatinilytica]